MTNSQELFGLQEAAPAEAVVADKQPEAEAEVPQESVFSTIVGEGKRFSNADALAKAKIEADAHIKRIEEENAALRKKAESLDNNYSAILNKLEEKKNVSTQDQDAFKVSAENKGIDLEQLIESKLTKREQKIIEEANIKKAQELATQTYGNFEVVQKVVDEFLKEKPYMEDAVRKLLRSNPETFVKEIVAFRAPETVGSDATDPLGSVKAGHVDSNSRYISWADACEVRRKDLKKYSSPEFRALVEASAEYYKSKGLNYYN